MAITPWWRGRCDLLSCICSIYLCSVPYNAEYLKTEVSSTIFLVISMTRPGIELRSLGLLAKYCQLFSLLARLFTPGYTDFFPFSTESILFRSVSILADLNSTVVVMVSILYPICSSSSLLGDHFKNINSNWYHSLCHISQIVLLCGKIQPFVYLFTFLHFPYMVRWNDKISEMTSSFSLLINTKSTHLSLSLRFSDPF